VGGGLIGIGLYALADQLQSGDGVRIDSVADVLFNVGLIIAILGALIFFVSFAGCIGALRENTFLLKLVRNSVHSI
jgi:tetraspanin-33